MPMFGADVRAMSPSLSAHHGNRNTIALLVRAAEVLPSYAAETVTAAAPTAPAVVVTVGAESALYPIADKSPSKLS